MIGGSADLGLGGRCLATMGDEEEKATLTAALIERENVGTVPVDPRFPNTNQVRSHVLSPRQLECGAPQFGRSARSPRSAAPRAAPRRAPPLPAEGAGLLPQNKYCYALYTKFQRCIKDESNDCRQLQRWTTDMCPSEWVTAWNDLLEVGAFPAPKGSV